jgi:NodT family efflux transporter outer membrane factor (OMF) lipoprotein
VLLAFAGCTVGPNFQRPKTTLSANWQETGDPRVSTASATYRGWWTAFNDPVLDRLIQRAYRENLSLRQAGVRVLQARAQLGVAIGEIFPQTQQAIGSVQYNRTSDRAATAPAVKGGVEYWQSQIGAQASWELDFWGRIRRSIESADASLLSTLADYDNTLVTLTADVANSYITIRTAEERIRIARENVATQEESLKIAEAKFAYGTATQLDVEQARTALLNTLATIPSLETQLRQARDALSVLAGMPPTDLSDLLSGPSVIPVSPRQVIVGIPADLLRRRPDVRRAELQAAAQSAQIGVAKADLYPAFSLVGNLVFVSTDLGKFKLSDMFRWGSRQVQVGPSVQWNILNYGQITNDVRVQDASFQQLMIAYQNAVLSAQQDVEDNLVAFLRAGPGGSLGSERRVRQERCRSRRSPVPGGRDGLHHGPDRPAGSPESAGQPGQHARQHFHEPRRDVPRVGRRLGDPRRPGSGAARDQGGDAAAHELGGLAEAVQLQSAGIA